MSAKRKACSRCGQVKTVGAFPARGNQCKTCQRRVYDRWVAANLERVAELKRRYCEANPEKVAASQSAYREANRQKIRARQRLRKEHPPAALAELDGYQRQCRELFRAQAKKKARKA